MSPTRWVGALVGAVGVISSTPLVARALTTESIPAGTAAAALERAERTSTFELDASIDADPATAATLAGASSDVVERQPAAPNESVEPRVDPVIAVLADAYTWDERSARVAVLRVAVGLEPDGRYGPTTQQAHLAALDFVGLDAAHVPAPPLPPGPSAEQWAALRQCESGGDYAITNPSGKYRGAYQFDRSTWNSVAERHAPNLVGVDPAAAAPGAQDAMAYALYSERGAQPWPRCGRHL